MSLTREPFNVLRSYVMVSIHHVSIVMHVQSYRRWTDGMYWILMIVALTAWQKRIEIAVFLLFWLIIKYWSVCSWPCCELALLISFRPPLLWGVIDVQVSSILLRFCCIRCSIWLWRTLYMRSRNKGLSAFLHSCILAVLQSCMSCLAQQQRQGQDDDHLPL